MKEETKTTEELQPSQAKENAIKKLIKFIKEHENLRQLIFFTLFSLVCFVIEYLSFTILKFCLLKVNKPVNWFVFNYETDIGGLGAFIAFLISNILAQIATFVLNRKKTFNATNNVAISGTMYAIVVCGIIVLNTYLGSVISSAIFKSLKSYSPISEKTMNNIAAYASKFVGSFLSFVISFVANKFLIMRNWGGSKKVDLNANEEQAIEAKSE